MMRRSFRGLAVGFLDITLFRQLLGPIGRGSGEVEELM